MARPLQPAAVPGGRARQAAALASGVERMERSSRPVALPDGPARQAAPSLRRAVLLAWPPEAGRPASAAAPELSPEASRPRAVSFARPFSAPAFAWSPAPAPAQAGSPSGQRARIRRWLVHHWQERPRPIAHRRGRKGLCPPSAGAETCSFASSPTGSCSPAGSQQRESAKSDLSGGDMAGSWPCQAAKKKQPLRTRAQKKPPSGCRDVICVTAMGRGACPL